MATSRSLSLRLLVTRLCPRRVPWCLCGAAAAKGRRAGGSSDHRGVWESQPRGSTPRSYETSNCPWSCTAGGNSRWETANLEICVACFLTTRLLRLPEYGDLPRMIKVVLNDPVQ